MKLYFYIQYEPTTTTMKSYQQQLEERKNKEKALFWSLVLSAGLIYFCMKTVIWQQQTITTQIKHASELTILTDKPQPSPPVPPKKIQPRPKQPIKSGGGQAAPNYKKKEKIEESISSKRPSPVKIRAAEPPSSSINQMGYNTVPIKKPTRSGEGDGDNFTGTLLSMDGWAFKSKPFVADDSDESGIVKFEIVVDERGNILNIRTLKTSLTPSITALYKEAVARAQFKRIVRDETPPISRGTIVFRIKAI